ncbi:MAG: bifunctional diaminohydroxyphosphoribosylaminopyrimidine deaminase/5-amino-6-(5-phosphoribosylamino)uracil reductase RibD [Chlamydiales bacterium]
MSHEQLFFMRRAIALAEEGRLTAPPNPWVGCVLVREGKIIGEGYHEAPGKPHAERMALAQAGDAKGATAFVSLEPCSHYGRTPPCVDALIEAGISRVVIPYLDPDLRVAGRGVKALEAAGISVIIGVGKEEALRSLEPYLHHRRTKLPFCILKMACSLDGRVAAQDGSSQWITAEGARMDGHRLRASVQAVMIGVHTAIVDKPQLTARIEGASQPLRIVLDSKGRLPPEGPLFDPSLAPTLIFTTKPNAAWKNVEVVVLPKLELLSVLQKLGERGIIQLLVEGGAILHSSFLRGGFAQKVVVYMGNCFLGDKGLPSVQLEVPHISNVPRLRLESATPIGNDVRLLYSV